jgi:hypothetical protein
MQHTNTGEVCFGWPDFVWNSESGEEEAPPLVVDFGQKRRLPPSSGESLPRPLLRIADLPHLLTLALCCRSRSIRRRPLLPHCHPGTPQPGMDSTPQRRPDALVSYPHLGVALPVGLATWELPTSAHGSCHRKHAMRGDRPGRAHTPCTGRGPRGLSQQCTLLGHFEPMHCWVVFFLFQIILNIETNSKL